MPRFSITSILFITVYFATCSLNYVSRNPTIGWLFVVATAILIAAIMIRAFNTRDAFGLGFSVGAGLWLSLSLGFVFETSTAFKFFDFRTPVWRIMSFGYQFVEFEGGAKFEKSRVHDLYQSLTMIRLPEHRNIPTYQNTLRLAACWSALAAGLIGGLAISFVIKRKPQRTYASTEATDVPASTRLPLLSIMSLIFIVAYFTICALTYAFENVTIGWFIVIATAIWIAVVAIQSFQTRTAFRLGFAVFGNLWLASVLGFALETPNGFNAYDIRTPVWETMSFGRKSPTIEDYTTLRKSTMHDWYRSMTYARLPNDREVPNRGTTLRLAACLSALFAGLLGGLCFSVIFKPDTP